jgi:hypothetical protein
MEWHLQPTKGDKPCPRDGHCMVLDPVRERCALDDVDTLSGTQATWGCITKLAYPNYFFSATIACGLMRMCNYERAKAHQTFFIFKCRLIVFGGRKQNKRRLNDIYFLDLATWTW